jgi:hypothetical protein
MDALVVLPRGDASTWLQGRVLAPFALGGGERDESPGGGDAGGGCSTGAHAPKQRCAFAARADRHAHACLCPADGSRRHMTASAILWPSGEVVGCGVVVWTGGSLVTLRPLDAADADHAHADTDDDDDDDDGVGASGPSASARRLHAGTPARAQLEFVGSHAMEASSAAPAVLGQFPDIFGSPPDARAAPDALIVLGKCTITPIRSEATGRRDRTEPHDSAAVTSALHAGPPVSAARSLAPRAWITARGAPAATTSAAVGGEPTMLPESVDVTDAV